MFSPNPDVLIVDTPIGRIVATTCMTAQQLKDFIESNKIQEFWHKTKKNADGTPMRWRRNGEIKLFKRDPSRFRMPIKHGLYSYDRVESIEDFNRFLVIPVR